LLGDRWERYAAGFDEQELLLAVLPLLVMRKLEEGAPGVAYVAIDATPTGAPGDGGPGLAIDPWPPRPGSDEGRLDVLIVRGSPGASRLLERWALLAAGVLEEEDRTLTARTTLRWLRAFAEVMPDTAIAPAGVAGRSREQPRAAGSAAPGYGFAALPAGPGLTPALRRLMRRASRDGTYPRPFSNPDRRALMQWLAEPMDDIGGVPRYLAALCERRSDLREAWSDGTPESARMLLSWAHEHGRLEDPVLPLILGPAARSGPSGPSSPTRGASPSRGAEPHPWGVNVVGHFQSELGIADAARLVVAALETARVPLSPVSAATARPPSRHDHPFVSSDSGTHPFSINLLCLNPDGVLAIRQNDGEELFAGRPTIGYWWWEIQGAFPPSWLPAFELVDEVWVGSHHVHEAIAPASTVPVRIVPIPVLPLDPAKSRSDLDLPEGFLFMTVFDYNSAFERKNPLAVVRAFKQAFAPGSGAKLLVKSINAAHQPDNRDELAICAGGHPDIDLRDGYLSAPEIDALLAQADCVVSLHRAEGFGLPLARALRSGIPVLATAYGGNVDFMTDENSYLVSHRPATVPEATIYPPGAPWVEPDLDAAAQLLRRVFDHPDEARERARRGAVELARTHSVEVTGARMASELRRVGNGSPRHGGHTAFRRRFRRAGSRRRGPS
jgi:glycosyltransferase involved in cell wall biosynthesis